MSKQIKLRCCLFFRDLNHPIAEAVFFHWLNLAVLMILLLILSRILLLIFPISDLVGLISRQVGLLAKFGLWSYECFFASCLVYSVVYTQFRCDVFVFCVDGLYGVRLCFFVGLGNVLFEKVVVCGWF